MKTGDLIRSKDDSVGIVAEVLEKRSGGRGFLAKSIIDGTEFVAKPGLFRVWKTKNELARLAILSDGGCDGCHRYGLQVYGWQAKRGVYNYYLLPCGKCQKAKLKELANNICQGCESSGCAPKFTDTPCVCVARVEFRI